MSILDDNQTEGLHSVLDSALDEMGNPDELLFKKPSLGKGITMGPLVTAANDYIQRQVEGNIQGGIAQDYVLQYLHERGYELYKKNPRFHYAQEPPAKFVRIS